MTDQQLIVKSERLRRMVQTDGYQDLIDEIQERQNDGWRKFIKLPVAQKTGKMAQKFQADYEVLGDILEWVNETIAAGDQAKEIEARKR